MFFRAFDGVYVTFMVSFFNIRDGNGALEGIFLLQLLSSNILLVGYITISSNQLLFRICKATQLGNNDSYNNIKTILLFIKSIARSTINSGHHSSRCASRTV